MPVVPDSRTGYSVDVGHEKMPQFEKAAEAVADFQRRIPGLILFLEARRDLVDLVRQLRVGQQSDDLQYLDNAV